MRRAPRTVVTALAFSAALSVGCGAGLAQRGAVDVAAGAEPEPWRTAVAEATRRHEPYEWAMREADLRATLITPRVRKAFIDHRAEFNGRFADETALDLIALGSADEGVDATMVKGPSAEEEVLVFVAMWVADTVNRDLAAGYTIWDTRLVRGNARVKALKVESLRQSPAVADLFPYIDRYDELYLFRFPLVDAATGTAMLSPGGEPLRLEARSAITDAVVEWQLQ